MAKYYPQAPIDWATTLEKIYARQSKQLEEHHANLRQRDKQMVDKINKDNFVDNLAKVAQFSTSAGSLVQSVKTARAANEEKDRSAFAVKWAANGFTEDQIKTYNDTYNIDKISILKGDRRSQKVIEALKADGKLKLAEALENISAKERIFAQELIAKKTVATTVNESGFNAHLIKSGGLKAFEALSFPDKDSKVKAWQIEQLSHLQLSDEFLAATVLGELDRKSSTSRNLSIAKSNVDYSSKKDLNFLEQLSTRSGDPIALGSFADSTHSDLTARFEENPQEGFTPTQSATQTIANRFERLLMDEHINLDDVNSYLGYNIEHPAGDNVGKAYFSKEQVNELVAAGKLGAGRKQARNDAIVNKEAFDLRTKALTPGSFESTEDYYAEIDSLVSRGLSSEAADDLKKLKLFAQTADHYNSTLKQYTPIKIINSSLEEINQIANEPARKLIRRRKLQLIESEKYGVSKGSMDSIIMNAPNRAVPWTVGMPVKGTGVSGEIAMEIDNQGEELRAQLVWAQYDDDGNIIPGKENTEINTIVSTYKRNLWDSRGGGTKDKEGLYSIDTMTNTFSNYIEQSRDVSTLGKGSDYNKTNYMIWERQANGYTHWTKKSATPLLTKEDIQHVFLTNDMSDRMEYLMARFPEYKMEEVLQHSINIYSKIEKHDGWTSALGLQEGDKKNPLTAFKGDEEKRRESKELMIEGLDIVLNDYLEGSPEHIDASALGKILKIKPWAYLEPDQKKRVLIYLTQNTEKKEHFDYLEKLRQYQVKLEDSIKSQNVIDEVNAYEKERQQNLTNSAPDDKNLTQ